MLITSLSVPGTHLQCQPRPYGDVWNKLHKAYIIWTGGGMSLQGVRTCGGKWLPIIPPTMNMTFIITFISDYMFSGHTVALTLLNFFLIIILLNKLY